MYSCICRRITGEEQGEIVHECVDAYMQAGMTLLQEYEGAVLCTAISDDSKLIASCDYDGNIAIWDICTSQRMHSFEGHGGRMIFGVDFSKDGKWLVSSGDESMGPQRGSNSDGAANANGAHWLCVVCQAVA